MKKIKKIFVCIIVTVGLILFLRFLAMDGNELLVIKLGNYDGKPLEWYVTKNYKDDCYTLVSKDAIRIIDINNLSTRRWAESEIREWLNNDFFEKAFSEKAKSMMVDTFRLDNGNCICDKVYLLSAGEATHYIPSKYLQCKYEGKKVNWYVSDFMMINERGKIDTIKEGTEVYARPVITFNIKEYSNAELQNLNIDVDALRYKYSFSENEFEEYLEIAKDIFESENAPAKRLDGAYNWVYDNYKRLELQNDPVEIMAFLLDAMEIENSIVHGRYTIISDVEHNWNNVKIDINISVNIDIECDIKNEHRNQNGVYIEGTLDTKHSRNIPYLSILKPWEKYNLKFKDVIYTKQYEHFAKMKSDDPNGLDWYKINVNYNYHYWQLYFIDGITGDVLGYTDTNPVYTKIDTQYGEMEFRIEPSKDRFYEYPYYQYWFYCTKGYDNLIIYGDTTPDSKDPGKNIFDNDWYKTAKGYWYVVR